MRILRLGEGTLFWKDMTTPSPRSDIGRPWVGIGWMMFTGLMFVCVTGIVRYIGSDVPAAQAAFIRYVIGLVIMLPFMGEIFKGKFSGGDLAFYSVRGVLPCVGRDPVVLCHGPYSDRRGDSHWLSLAHLYRHWSSDFSGRNAGSAADLGDCCGLCRGHGHSATRISNHQ